MMDVLTAERFNELERKLDVIAEMAYSTLEKVNPEKAAAMVVKDDRETKADKQ